ncbi:phosphatidylinositol-3,5-bisphosphate 5-phosphatase [Rhizina undulata]
MEKESTPPPPAVSPDGIGRRTSQKFVDGPGIKSPSPEAAPPTTDEHDISECRACNISSSNGTKDHTSSGGQTPDDTPAVSITPPTPISQDLRVETATAPVLQRSPTYPQLSNNPPASPASSSGTDDKDEVPSVPKPFDRSDPCTNGNTKQQHRHRESGGHATDKEEYEGTRRRIHKFTLYETATRYYIVGADLQDTRFRIMKIDRTAEEGDLSIIEDEVVYTREEMTRLLATIEHGNKSTGGLKNKCPFWGLLGFIRFTGAYYMLLITRRSIVAMIGGHYVYQIDNTELIPLTSSTSSKKPERNSEEARFVSILGNLDLTRSFYFSYSYDITRTLQHNIIREREALGKGLAHHVTHDYNDMFAWNHYLLEPAKMCLKNTYDWCMPIVHGYVDQSTLSVYGRVVYITIIARRSRYFAGARFLKRGANDLGYVANDVETEQIVSEMLTTSFHSPGKNLYSNPHYTSYVQHRGSIPLFWTQKNDAATPKPPVEMNLVDPFFSAAALHFDDLFQRYGAPVMVLNLVKSKERTPRESILLKEFTQAINYLNQFLPKDKLIRYKAWDMSRASKSRDQDVIETLEKFGEKVVNTTGFFHNGISADGSRTPRLQNGVCRTNCIDCLDRTNAAQFVIGKRALAHQLHALGIIPDTTLDYDTDAVNLFTHMYHDHGDTIAVQYAGSHLVNTMETYRKINQWTSHSRDMLESFKRYYNNSFLDGQRQEAYNLFLGNYIFAQGQPMLWDLSTDYYLHHADPRLGRRRRSYVKWWTPKNLETRILPELATPSEEFSNKPYHFFDDYWLEYYRPKALSSFLKVFAYNLNSTLRYVPLKMTQEGKYDLSPFTVRSHHNHHHSVDQHPPSRSKRSRKSKTSTTDPPEEETAEGRLKKITSRQPPSSSQQYQPPASSSSRRQEWPQEHTLRSGSPLKQPLVGKDLIPFEQRNMKQAVERSLNPSLSVKETEEYELYMSHPLNLPLVTTTELPPNPSIDFVEYVNSTSPEAAASLTVKEEDICLYEEVLVVPENALSVDEKDGEKKRYKAYQQWITTGKLKQQRIGGLVGIRV